MPYFQEASQKTGTSRKGSAGLPQARQESGFNLNAVRGGAGEIGMFQIKLPARRPTLGGGVQGVDPATLAGPGNVRNNILFGAQYLKSRMQGDPGQPGGCRWRDCVPTERRRRSELRAECVPLSPSAGTARRHDGQRCTACGCSWRCASPASTQSVRRPRRASRSHGGTHCGASPGARAR